MNDQGSEGIPECRMIVRFGHSIFTCLSKISNYELRAYDRCPMTPRDVRVCITRKLRKRQSGTEWREIERASYPARIVIHAMFIYVKGDVYFHESAKQRRARFPSV